VFVVLSAEELARETPKASRAIEVLRCVPRGAIDPAWWNRPYLLGPDGREDGYYALAQALEDAGRFGVARWVMRGKRYAGGLVPREGRLALVTLQPAEAVVAAEQLAKPESPPVRKGERELAEQLVAALDAPFEPAELRDEHRERLLELVAAKAAGKKPRLEPVAAKRPTDDLTRALRESLRAARERRVA
jgi:DNA end-binding protein Ku